MLNLLGTGCVFGYISHLDGAGVVALDEIGDGGSEMGLGYVMREGSLGASSSS